MSDTESVDYLLDGFDPKSLTVPRLRSILVTHNVQYPATAKKQDLIDLFTDHVVPQSKKILAARARAKRSSMGITNADSQSTTSTDFDEDLMPPPPSISRARSPRKSTRVKSESVDPEPAPLRESPRKRQSRSASTQLAPTSDTDTADTLRSGRRSQRSTPAPKLEPPEEESFFKRTPETEDVSSSANPFQSGGSSPPAPVKTPSNRRKTTGMESGKLSRTPSAGRRRTDGPTYDDHDGFDTVSKSFEMPISRISSRKTPEPPLTYIEPGEEFTPEEQLALDQEEQANPQLALARRKVRPAKRGSALSTPIWVLATTLFVAYAAWYRQEKVAVGYCGLGRDPGQLIPATVQLPDWAAELASKIGLESADIKVPGWVMPFVEPECEPCPPHAYCYEDFTVRCEPDFILKPHPLSLGGVIPLPPTCEPDGEKVRRVQAVADKAVEELRDRRAKFECGEPAEPEGAPVDSPSIEEEELKEVLSQKRSKRMNAEEFDDLWTAAIGEIKAREEVQVEEVEPQVDEPIAEPIEPEVPLVFLPPDYHPPLSLAFRTPARSSAPSNSDWLDIDSALAD